VTLDLAGHGSHNLCASNQHTADNTASLIADSKLPKVNAPF